MGRSKQGAGDTRVVGTIYEQGIQGPGSGNEVQGAEKRAQRLDPSKKTWQEFAAELEDREEKNDDVEVVGYAATSRQKRRRRRWKFALLSLSSRESANKTIAGRDGLSGVAVALPCSGKSARGGRHCISVLFFPPSLPLMK